MEAGTVPEKVTISHRGARYEIGRGKRYYGIWVTGAPESDPVDRWPETREGWAQAWTRFTAMETPGTITAVEQPRAGFRLPGLKLPAGGLNRIRAASGTAGQAVVGRWSEPGRATAGAGLLALGVLLGVIGLFPGYVGPRSLASQADQLVPHVLYLAGWAASAVLIGRGALSRGDAARLGSTRPGALFGIGLSAVTFGLFFADLGQVIAGGSSLLGAGLLLSMLGWLACAAGSALAFTVRPRTVLPGPVASGPARPRPADAGPMALLLLAAIGAVAAFAPSWDSYTLTQASTGASQTITAGNAFANPGAVIFGDVAVMVAVVGVAALAAIWRPVRHGAVLLAGAILPLVAQAISALVQVSEPATPALFGISQQQAAAAGLTISAGVTPIFWVYCVFVISLLISCAWMLTAPHYPAMPAAQRSAQESPQPGQGGPSQSVNGTPASSDGGAEGDEESTYA